MYAPMTQYAVQGQGQQKVPSAGLTRSGTSPSLHSGGSSKGKKTLIEKLLRSKPSMASMGSMPSTGSMPSMASLAEAASENGSKHVSKLSSSGPQLASLESAGYIRPAELKARGRRLEPRQEPEGRSTGKSEKSTSKKALTTCHSPASRIIEQNRLLTSEILCGGQNDRSLEPLRQLALHISLDFKDVPAWFAFLASYWKGEYNVNNLPPHPPMGPRFEFLSAPYVEVDSSQLSSAIKTGTPWKAWTYQLFGEAVLTFDVQTATISAFDSKFERFRATTGSTWEQIDRKISIAAHALFSAETMCILDAEEDWRFMKNPLVKAGKVRFFAGTPMFSRDGNIIGVFSISSEEPRSSFTAKDKHELQSFAVAATETLLGPTDMQVSRRDRNTPILQRESFINGEHEIKDFPELSPLRNPRYSMMPGGLNFQKFQKRKPSNRVPYGLTVNTPRSDPAENTPPPSAESNREPSFGSDSLFEKHTALDSQGPELTPPPDVCEFQEESLIIPHRPFSDSDLTSLHMIPVNSPDVSVNEESFSHQPNLDVTYEDFAALEDRDVSEDSVVDVESVRDLGATAQESDATVFLPEGPSSEQMRAPEDTSDAAATDSRSAPSTRILNSSQVLDKSDGEIKIGLQRDVSESLLTATRNSIPPCAFAMPRYASQEICLQPSLRRSRRQRLDLIMSDTSTKEEFEDSSQESYAFSITEATPSKSRSDRQDVRATVAHMLGHAAKQLRWELLYLAHVTGGGVNLTCFAAHGLKQATSWDATFHSGALPLEEPLRFDLTTKNANMAGYKFARFLRVHAEKSMLDGYVLAAFRASGEAPTPQEESGLKVLAENLKVVVLEEPDTRAPSPSISIPSSPAIPITPASRLPTPIYRIPTASRQSPSPVQGGHAVSTTNTPGSRPGSRLRETRPSPLPSGSVTGSSLPLPLASSTSRGGLRSSTSRANLRGATSRADRGPSPLPRTEYRFR